MDRTINKIIIGFMLLVIFDCTSFSIEKTKFGLFGSVIHVVKTVKSFANIMTK